jgi:hypothetical protein
VPVARPLDTLFSAFQQAPRFVLVPRQFAQVRNGALKTGVRILDRMSRKTREQFGHSLAREMGLNPSFFKAGAGGGEV